MAIDATEISKLLAALVRKRPVFCSEMDFQLHLAWEMKERGWDVLLECDPLCFDANASIDILVQKPQRVAVELKYKTARLDCNLDGRPLCLKNQAAQTIARYDIIKDISRIETVVAAGQAERGFAVFLTNDSGYWRKGKAAETADASFRMFDGHSMVKGELYWGQKASEGTKKGREKPIRLTHDYYLRWKDYAKFDGKNGVFRYLLVEVEPLPSEQRKAMA